MDERVNLIELIKLKERMFDRSELPPDILSLTDNTDPETMKETVITCLLKTIRKNYASPVLSEQMLGLIDRLRKGGVDYPELAAIEKSLKAG